MKALLVLLALGACHAKPIVQTPVVKVEIVKPIPGSEKFCDFIDDAPVPPEPIDYRVDNDIDLISRVFVHYREYNDMVAWVHLTTMWMTQVKQCLMVLQGE
jgi:hypothetical protein